MTNEEAIRVLETDCHSPFPFTPGELDKACRMGADALRAQKTPAKLDRIRWEGCCLCAGFWNYNFCPECGRPITEDAWAELERRINGGTID